MNHDLIALRIRGVFLELSGGLPMVALEDKKRSKTLVFPVGPSEAKAIITELEGLSPPGPLTHDLLVSIFREAGFELNRVILFGSVTPAPRARLDYHRGPMPLGREVEPADALALALRLDAPVFCEAALLRPRLGLKQKTSSSCPRGRLRTKVFSMEEWKSRELEA